MTDRPRTNARFDQRHLNDLLRTVRIRSEARRGVAQDAAWCSPLPEEVAFQLTYKCNLRCHHCFQWNDQGFFWSYGEEQQQGELDFGIIERVIAETAPAKSKIFLWGGEPLMHSRFADLARLLARDPRTVTLCTNGLLIERHLADLLPLGPAGLVVYVSLDGLEADHDALRGRGTHRRIVRQMKLLIDLKRKGEFAGEISSSSMVNEHTVGHLYDVAQQAEDMGLNSLYFQLPWFIGPESARAMDAFYAERFGWLNPPAPSGKGTWHSYSYRLPPERIPELRADMARIAARTWNIRIRYQPEVRADEIDAFIGGASTPVQGKRTCLAIANRMEVHADGNVSACKFFPEFVVGSLRDAGVAEIWRGERFHRARTLLHEAGLTPVCSKCLLLYLNGD
jgi:radical SAM protein with 4Fe4S-binding SPASM domain